MYEWGDYGLYQVTACVETNPGSQKCDPALTPITKNLFNLKGISSWWTYNWVVGNGPTYGQCSPDLNLQVASADQQVTTVPYHHGILGIQYNGSTNPAVVSDGNRNVSLDMRTLGQLYEWTPYDEPMVNIGGVVNAATYKATAMSPGDIETAFGLGLSSEHAMVSQGYPLPTTLGRIQVQILASDNQVYLCPLYYDSEFQVNFQVPYGVPMGPATVTVVVGVTPSNPIPVTIDGADPGIFPEAGGTGAVLHAATYQLVTNDNPAKPGEYILVYWTGGGSVTPSVQAGAAVAYLTTTNHPVGVNFNAQTEQPYWSGLAPYYAGLYQTNVLVPPGLTGPVNLSLTVNGRTSNVVTLPVISQ